MSIVDRIEEVAKKKGLTFKKLEREAGLGNGTIRRWEIQSPRLDKLVPVAEYLHVPLDYLVYGRSETATGGPTCDGVPLSMVEADLVAMFRDLKASEKEIAFQFVTMLYQRKTGGLPPLSRRLLRTKKAPPREGRSPRRRRLFFCPGMIKKLIKSLSDW